MNDEENSNENYEKEREFAKFIYEFVDSYDYLRIEGPSHILQNNPARFKGNLFDPFANVRFHTGEDGYVGKDKSNIEANAYKHVTFDRHYGPSAVWITRSGLCSAKGVWVQKRPKISKVSIEGGKLLDVTVKYSLDKYSKYYLSGERPEVTIRWFSEAGLSGQKVVKADPRSGTLSTTLHGLSGGDLYVSAIINDGNFKNSVDMGKVFITNKVLPPCKGCEIGI